ncbi:MAG: multidrug efflux SMR transporter [Acinetobacter sp.]
MAWLYLIIAGCAEIIYAALIVKSQGFTKLIPSFFCCIFIMISIYLLSLAAKTIPLGTAYAVWVGIGAVGTAIYGIVVLGESTSILRMCCFGLIIIGIIGLKFIHQLE